MTNDFLIEALVELDANGLKRSMRLMDGAQFKTVRMNGKSVLNFCSNNYLGLANDPRLSVAASQAMGQYGFGSGASRLVCGNMAAHEKLEHALAKLKGTASCLLFNSGYSANTGVIPALFGREDIIFSDKLNHASIVDGILLSRAEFKRYAHLDMASLEDGLKNAVGFKKKLIVTDSIFSMDGDVAPLKAIVNLAKRYDAWVMVDEAHGFGVLGEHGGGLTEELGLSKDIEIQMGTLSKAAGCFGAYVCGSDPLRDYLINHSRSFIYTTALPPSLAMAAQLAIGIIDSEEGKRHREQLKINAEYVRAGLKGMGFDVMNSTTPIIPILVHDADKAVAMTKHLLEQGIFVQAIRPPTVPVHMARLRVTVMATHAQEDLDHLLNSLRKL